MSARRMERSGLYRSIVLGCVALGAGFTLASCASGGSTGDSSSTGAGGDPGAGGSNAGGSSAGGGKAAGGASGTSGTGKGGASGTGAGPGGGGDAGASAAGGTGGTAGANAGGAAGSSGGKAGAAGATAGGAAGATAGGAAGAAGGGKAGAGGATAGGAGGAAGATAGGAAGNGGGGTCVPGDPCTVPNKNGECAKGINSCSGGVATCKQVIFPGTELCDGKDNDCDTIVDNGPPWADATGMTCDTKLKGVCKAGTNTCDKMGKIVCTQNVQMMNEVCNGLDDDCDGVVDNGSPGAGLDCVVPMQPPNSPCAKGKTGCGMDGQIHCLQVNVATSETCDGIDNDCNGSIDDMLQGSPCDTKLMGVCGGPSSGTLTCMGGVGNCVPKIGPGTNPEICDGKDNNCNGQTDEGAANMLCPSGVFVSQWACAGGACQITQCALGHGDVDGSATNGCECATDSYASTCSATGNGTSIPAGGGTSTFTGIVDTAAGSKWFRVVFTNPGTLGALYHPSVTLTNDGGGIYQMDVNGDCSNIAKCNDNNDGTKVNIWEQNIVYDKTGAPTGCCSDMSPRVAEVYVRVYLKQGAMPACTPFSIVAKNP